MSDRSQYAAAPAWAQPVAQPSLDEMVEEVTATEPLAFHVARVEDGHGATEELDEQILGGLVAP